MFIKKRDSFGKTTDSKIKKFIEKLYHLNFLYLLFPARGQRALLKGHAVASPEKMPQAAYWSVMIANNLINTHF